MVTTGARSTDVIVVGAGIIGASCAYQLTRRGLSVRVLERQEAPGQGSTGRSFASVRAQWGDPLNVEISWRSIQTYRDFEQLHGVDVGYRPTGYLFLVSDALWDSQLRCVEIQRAHGVRVETLDVEEAQRLTPFDAQGIAGAAWGPDDGVVDPLAVTHAFLGMARAAGADLRTRTAVESASRVGDRWRVGTTSETFDATWVVNAAGGWAGELGTLAGLEIPVEHSRRNIYSTASVPGRKPLPMTVELETGSFLRSEGHRLLFSIHEGEEPAGYNTDVDWVRFEGVLERMCDRFPWFVDQPLDRVAAWAGTYEVTPDHFPVLGANPARPGWIDACGFSGHGVMQAPMIGLLVAEEVADGRATTLDIGPLRLDRFANGATVREHMVF